jgi:hypothetical protein
MRIKKHAQQQKIKNKNSKTLQQSGQHVHHWHWIAVQIYSRY